MPDAWDECHHASSNRFCDSHRNSLFVYLRSFGFRSCHTMGQPLVSSLDQFSFPMQFIHYPPACATNLAKKVLYCFISADDRVPRNSSIMVSLMPMLRNSLSRNHEM